MKQNRAPDAPRRGLLYRSETSSRDEKRHAFEKFYKGWRDYLEGRPMITPPGWPEADRQWYHLGCEKARTERQAKELAPTG